MKIAICFSGLPRFVKEGFKLFSKNLIGFDNMDIFFHSWGNNAVGNSDRLSRLDSIEEVNRLYNITESIEEVQKCDIAPAGISSKEFVHWSMFYSIWSANELKKRYEAKHNMKYDYVIRTRFDCALLEPLDVTKYKTNTVCVPWLHRRSTVMDWLNFSNSSVMDTHTNLFNHMTEYKISNVPMVSGEELLTHHLAKNGIKITNTNTNVKLIRIGNGSSTWINVSQL